MAFVVLWWSFFFTEPTQLPQLPTAPKKEGVFQKNPLPRKVLIQALQGDFSLVASLILQWDMEAQAEQKNRLEAEKVLRAQFLAHSIVTRPEIATIKILPQTYVAAGILLAIASPQQLVALPRGLREQTELYPPYLTNQIPLDIDHYTTEKLFLAHPDIALVSSHYTHPAALQALSNQGVPAILSPYCKNSRDIAQEIGAIGKLIGRNEEAELLQLFMEAAFLKLDQEPKTKEKTLFLSYYDHFYFPKDSNITGEIVKRAGIPLPETSPLALKEKLLEWAPERLIIAVPTGLNLLPFLEKDPGYAQLQAVRTKNVYLIDDGILQTPTHFSILAYYDLIQALRP